MVLDRPKPARDQALAARTGDFDGGNSSCAATAAENKDIEIRNKALCHI
jgi:hypothetical protein